MRTFHSLRILTLAAVILALVPACKRSSRVEFRRDDASRKVDIRIGGSYFTSLYYPEDECKPILWPIMTSSGIDITRGYPRAPRAFESVDHIHHSGLWFNHGDVNGLDFWNANASMPEERRRLFGTVVLRSIESAVPPRIVTLSDWVDFDGNVLLSERTTYTFAGGRNVRSVVRTAELTAVDTVTFGEDKEGMLGLRVDRAFQQPSDQPTLYLDAEGKPSERRTVNKDGVTGLYTNSLGRTGDDCWGTRPEWTRLDGTKQGDDISILIVDSQDNPNAPAWSHARGYGLFGVNSLGGKAIEPGFSGAAAFTLLPGETKTFSYKIVIKDGGHLDDAASEAIARGFNPLYVPKAPDYGDSALWYTRKGDSDATGADIFYIVSTWEEDWKSQDGALSHYADVYNPEHREHMDREISRIADFMGPGNDFYSPYYRHMAIDTWATCDEDLIQARTRLAMQDVKDAFDEFLKTRRSGRPLVLAGFSQGGMAVVELLKHMDDRTYDDLAAAYVLGYKVTPGDTLASRHIRAAQRADDVGVTICYNTVKDVRYAQPAVSGDCVMCINPVNWRTDATPAVLHDTVTVSVSPEHHVLVVKGYDGSEYKPIRGMLNVGDIHSCEPWLYSAQLAENIALRVKVKRKE